jgi:hypothetical protein
MKRAAPHTGVLRSSREPSKAVSVKVEDDLVRLAVRCFGSERHVLLSGLEARALSRLLAGASAQALKESGERKGHESDVEAT